MGELKGDIRCRSREIHKLAAKASEVGGSKYTTVKGDPVDAALADWIRSSPPAAPFYRIRPGAYLFGSRKCSARLEQGILLIQCGATNAMPYEAFNASYGQEEAVAL